MMLACSATSEIRDDTSQSTDHRGLYRHYGVCGVLGLAAGRIEARFGLAPLFYGIFGAGAGALSLILIALAPRSWGAVLVASGLHGIAIMTVSAMLSFWSLPLFPGRGTVGFTATLLSMAAGSVVGLAVAGVLAASLGPAAKFLIASVPPLAMALWFGSKLRLPRRRLPAVTEGE